MYYYYDVTYGLVIIGMLLCLWASAHVNRVMKKYDKIQNSTGLTGAEAARRILNNEGLYNVWRARTEITLTPEPTQCVSPTEIITGHP